MPEKSVNAKVKLGMHASLWAAEWTKAAAELAIPEAAEYKLDVIEVPILVPDAIDAAHSAKLFERYGVEPTGSLCLPLEISAPLQPEKVTAFLIKALDKASALGAKFLGGVTYSALGYRSGNPPQQAEYEAAAMALAPAARHAKSLAMTLGIEPCNRYETHLLNSSAQALALQELIGEPNVTIHFDTYHMNIEEKGIGEAFRRTAGKCSYIHLSESDRGVPGTGNVAWDEAFRALASIGFSGYLVIESFVTLPPEIASALSVWRPVARDRQEVLTKGVPFLRGLAKVQGLII
jgi:D-psicose/D-tagatose/L-ribulose 3-epimerase